MDQLRLPAGVNHPEFDSEGKHGWGNTSEDDQDDVAHVPDIDHF
jgi:hypothetical protein